MTMEERWSVAVVAAALSGLIAWSLQFTLIYGLTSVACGRGFADAAWLGIDVVRGGTVAATLAAITWTGCALLAALRGRRRGERNRVGPGTRFLHDASILVNAFSLVAIAWNVVPPLLLPICA
jgi:hypothetical protein